MVGSVLWHATVIYVRRKEEYYVRGTLAAKVEAETVERKARVMAVRRRRKRPSRPAERRYQEGRPIQRKRRKGKGLFDPALFSMTRGRETSLRNQ